MAKKINKLSYEFDPFGIAGVEKPESKRVQKRIASEVAASVHEFILDYVGRAESPVSGEDWKKSLSPGYKKEKAKESSALIANMELHGDMLDALQVVAKNNGKVEVLIEGEQAAKADGHNKLVVGNDNLPQRRFIPDKDQTFKQPIINEIKDIVKDG